jgi:hypothetical protein
MGRRHARDARIWFDDQAGTCRELTSDFTTITMNRSQANPEVTTFGQGMIQRWDGMHDASIDLTAVWNSGSIDSVVGLLEQAYGGSLTTRVIYAPAGSTTGCPVYTASMRISTFNVTAPVDNMLTLTSTFQNATASMIAACCV